MKIARLTSWAIVGFDNDPEDIFERQIEFIRESAIPLAMVGLLMALPGTQLRWRLEREGRLLQESTGNNTDCTLNYVLKMNARRLVEGYKSILRTTIYSPREHYQRSLDCMYRVVVDVAKPRRSDFIGDATALVRIFLTLGVQDHDRREFWRYMYRALAGHREKFLVAVMLAALGYHFRKVMEAYCR